MIELTLEIIRKKITKSAWSLLNDIADDLYDQGFPLGRRIHFNGTTVSKTSEPEFWLKEKDNGDVLFNYTFVPGKPGNLYVDDLLNPKFIEDIVKSANTSFEAWKQRDEAERWVRDGKPCVYRSGWAWKGAGARRITKEEAEEMLPRYHFGKGFWELSFETIDGERVLEFNELSENDMW